MNSILKTKVTSLLLCLIISVCTLAGCTTSNVSPTTLPDTETEVPQATSETSDSADTALSDNTRFEYETQLAEIEELYKQNPGDQDIALQYSQTLYALGDFDEGQEVLTPYLNTENPSPDVVYLSAELEYLKGNYAEAEKLYKILVNEYYDEYGPAAVAGLQMVYYQTNEYSKANELFVGQELDNPLLDMMKAFDGTPYQLNWNGNEQTTIPFITTDPLPIIPIEINGVKINAIIDTGAPMLTVNESIASELGIESISNSEGGGAGGTVDTSFGKAGSLKLGEVDIQNIPVLLTSFDGFENGYDEYATDVHAFIGTNDLQQFIPFMDYPTGQLKLVPRDETGHERLSEMLSNENVLEEIPFTLSSTHYIFAKGSINGFAGLNMFVDSGLDDYEENGGAGIMLPKETMDILGITMPELNQASEDHGGLGGNDYKTGWFNLSSYGLNDLQLKAGTGVYYTSDILSSFIDYFGIIGDALISHNYLKQYKWIIDFDSMKMTFCE